MGTLTFPFTLTAGQLENVNQLNSNLTAIQTVLNGQVDATNLASNAVTTVKITDANVTTAKIAALNITTALIADANVTAAKIEAQQAWQTIALGGGGTWTPANLSYYKDSLGIVHFKGLASSFTGTVSAGATLCTLPAGYRPVDTQVFTLPRRDVATAHGPIEITSAGVVLVGPTALVASSAAYTFGMIHFRAEN